MDTETQLRSLFEDCADTDGLKYVGLEKLCDRLDLSHCWTKLAEDLCLTPNGERVVTYLEFRSVLIRLLGPESQPTGGRSPVREVSPKYVFGKKKYGRRSRPDITEGENDLVDSVEACSVEEESLGKKRRLCAETSNSGESSEEEMLVSAWTAVAPSDATLSQEELVEVFKGLGVDAGSAEAASTVFDKLNLSDGGITLAMLLSFIRSGATLSRDPNPPEFDTVSSTEFVDSSGFMTGSSIIEMWEAAGVMDGRELLGRLGARPGQQCDLANVTARFHGLLQSSRDENISGLCKAGLVLQRAYIQYLRGAVEQMSGEKEKLKSDVSEANHRSQLLAQEVDDHHARLEAATQRQVRALEQKHADRVRDLTEQVKLEQEQLIQQNQNLEKRLAVLEAEEGKTRVELSRVSEENQQIHDEHQSLLSQLTNLRGERDSLKKNVQELTVVQLKLQELEEMAKDRDVMALLDKVSGLETENRSLKDRNDELSLQIEHLTLKLQSSSIFQKRQCPDPVPNLVDPALNELSMDDINDVELCESLDAAMKSPQGLLAKESAASLEAPSQAGLDTARKTLLNQLSALGPAVGNDLSNDIIKQLEVAWSDSNPCECSSLKSTVETLSSDLTKMKEQDSKMKSRCQELEKSMEQLQEEYERTEDYWTSKLEEERTLFDAEQKINDEKFSDLVNKIAEYEQMMKEEVNVRQRLETIEEKDQLEKQVLEMEEEYSKLLSEKEEEIERLQQQLHPSVADAPAQTDLPIANPVGEASSAGPCRRSLSDRRRTCCKVYRLQNELRSLLEAKQSAQREISALLVERNMLYNQVLNQRRADGCNATLSSKLLCAERRCRTLMASLRNQQLQTSELLRSTWQQHKREVEELRAALSLTDSTLQQQAAQIQQQLSKMSAADTLVKDLFVENAYLLSAVRKLETRHNGTSH